MIHPFNGTGIGLNNMSKFNITFNKMKTTTGSKNLTFPSFRTSLGFKRWVVFSFEVRGQTLEEGGGSESHWDTYIRKISLGTSTRSVVH